MCSKRVGDINIIIILSVLEVWYLVLLSYFRRE